MTTTPIPLQILLAEDNDFNQEIVVDLLTEAGHRVTATNNGQELLEELRAKPHDFYQLILMDLEMPILDGHQATQEIRHNKQFDTIPIIAMTAHTTDHTKRQCAEEGMQDYISKPFTPDQLFALIRDWCQVDQTSLSIGTSIDTDISNSKHRQHNQDSDNQVSIKCQPSFNFKSINSQLGLQMTGNRPELYVQLLDRFRTSQVANLEFLHHVNQLDLQTTEFKRTIHTLKGVSATIGASQLASLVEDFERSLNNIDHQNVSMMIAKGDLLSICELLSQVITEINMFFSDYKPNNSAPQSDFDSLTDNAALIDTLVLLLESASMDANDYFHRYANAIARAVSIEHFKFIKQSIDEFEFDRAIDLLRLYQHSTRKNQ